MIDDLILGQKVTGVWMRVPSGAWSVVVAKPEPHPREILGHIRKEPTTGGRRLLPKTAGTTLQFDKLRTFGAKQINAKTRVHPVSLLSLPPSLTLAVVPSSWIVFPWKRVQWILENYFECSEGHDQRMLSTIISASCLFWYFAVLVVCAVGYIQLYRNYTKLPKRAVCESLLPDLIPHVTIIRPVKGLEPKLYECLASTYQQSYPREKLTIYLCVASHDDPALPILKRLVQDFSHFDTKVFVEEDDPVLSSDHAGANFGPNPKIRNMSRAYREAKGDTIWIVDCNIWVAKGVTGRMVDTLFGFDKSHPFKFVHQLPLVVDVNHDYFVKDSQSSLAASSDLNLDDNQATSTDTFAYDTISSSHLSAGGFSSKLWRLGGTNLEEAFLASSHAKFYSAINTVLIAPCICGKSTMFRRSHLDYLTSDGGDTRPGIDYFSHNICEDHLIGDLLWKRRVQEEVGPHAERLGKHALVFGDLAIQPMAAMSVSQYAARRVRWLRVRKFTVPAATFVEPGTESFLCSWYGAWGVTSLPWLHDNLKFPQSWTAFVVFWLLSVMLWALVDWTQYLMLHSVKTIEVDENTPAFAQGPYRGYRKKFSKWIIAWLGREALALPIWCTAIYGGVTVAWRGKRFRVGLDARVRSIDDPLSHPRDTNQVRARTSNHHLKSRIE